MGSCQTSLPKPPRRRGPHREPWHDTENPEVGTRDKSFAQNEWKVEGLGPAEGRADFSEDFWRGWVADLSDAELATLHAIVEEQQTKKKVVPKAKAKAAPTLAQLDEWENRPTT